MNHGPIPHNPRNELVTYTVTNECLLNYIINFIKIIKYVVENKEFNA